MELLEKLKTTPSLWLEERKRELDETIKTLPDRKAKFPGNITMKEYMLSLKKELEETPDLVIAREIAICEGTWQQK